MAATSPNDPTPYLPEGFPIDAVVTSDDWKSDQAHAHREGWQEVDDEHAADAPHDGCECRACDDAREDQYANVRRSGTTVTTHTYDGDVDVVIERYRTQFKTFYDITNVAGSITLTSLQASELRKALDYLLGPDTV